MRGDRQGQIGAAVLSKAVRLLSWRRLELKKVREFAGQRGVSKNVLRWECA